MFRNLIAVTLLLTVLSSLQCHATEVYDPTPNDRETSLYAIGKVGVGVILVEPPQATWTVEKEEDAMSIVTKGLDHFEEIARNNSVSLEFFAEYVFDVPTSYDLTEVGGIDSYDELWMAEVMSYIGYDGANYLDQMYDFCNDMRERLLTDWAIIIYICDLTYTLEPQFGNGHAAYAALMGPFVCYGYYYSRSNLMLTHEVAHCFGATDEYNGLTERWGYLYVEDDEGAPCLMNSFAYLNFCQATREQLGWRDTDGDTILDPIDNIDETVLNPYTPDPTTNRVLVYTGTSYVVPYPTPNPYLRDVTITKIANVQVRIDGGVWMNATPADGSFDSAVEEFFFQTPTLQPGQHQIESRSFNTVGNCDELPYASDTVLILEDDDVEPPTASFTTIPENITAETPVTFDASSSSSPNSSILSYSWDFGDGNKTTILFDPFVSHAYDSSGNYTVVLNVTNVHGLWDIETTSLRVWPSINSTDLNRDGVVNILDISIVASAFDSKPGDSHWNETADLDKNDVINIVDVSKVAADFGKTV